MRLCVVLGFRYLMVLGNIGAHFFFLKGVERGFSGIGGFMSFLFFYVFPFFCVWFCCVRF